MAAANTRITPKIVTAADILAIVNGPKVEDNGASTFSDKAIDFTADKLGSLYTGTARLGFALVSGGKHTMAHVAIDKATAELRADQKLAAHAARAAARVNAYNKRMAATANG